MEQSLDALLSQWHTGVGMSAAEAGRIRATILKPPEPNHGLSVAWWQSVLQVSGMWNGSAYIRAVVAAN